MMYNGIRISIFAVFVSVVLVSFAAVPFDMSKTKVMLNEPPLSHETSEVIANIERKIKKDPENIKLYELLALVSAQAGLYEKAAQALELEIAYWPGYTPGKDTLYGNLALAYINLGRLDEAKSALDKSLELNPDHITSRMHQVRYYILREQYTEAAQALQAMESLDDERDFYYDAFTYIFDKPDVQTSATVFFKEATRVNPDSHKAHRALATALRDSPGGIEKNFPAIVEEYTKALELNPEHIPTYISIANTYAFMAVESKKRVYFKDALKWIKKANRIESEDDTRLEYAAGYIYLLMERYDQAIKKLEYVASKKPYDSAPADMLAMAYNNKAYVLYEKGKRLKEALEIIDKAIKLRPDSGVILSTKAEILYKLRRYEEAHEYIKKAIALEPEAEEIKRDLINIEAALRERKAAKQE